LKRKKEMDKEQGSTGRESDKVMLRLPEGLRPLLKAEAARNRRSMNAEIVVRLAHSFDTIHGNGSGVALPLAAPGLRTASGRVASPQQATPLVGTPGVSGHAGNSTRAGANVRGSQKSERSGERALSEVNETRRPATAAKVW
jgi:hypothetical protein